MGFAQDIQELRPKVDFMMRYAKLLTPANMDKISKLSNIDWSTTEELSAAATVLSEYGTEIQTVNNGMNAINSVIGIQNQIQYVSDIRDSIGLVAGSIEHVKDVGEDLTYVRASVAMKPMIEDALALSVPMDKVIDMEEDMLRFEKTANRMEVVLKEMNKQKLEVERLTQQVSFMLGEANAIVSKMDKTLEKTIAITDEAKNLKIEVKHLGEKETAYSDYFRDTNCLEIGVPCGKTGPRGKWKGEKGEPGKNGTNFQPSYVGSSIDRSRFGAHPIGTSYLALDEIPTMVYFRKSNTRNDWTDGQPFGVSNGGYSEDGRGIDIVDGINVNELIKHVVAKIKKG